ncbi:MAG: hypothetical protein NZ580_02555 [Bacteroidia bacterium]|nr:hypothetical protein [Bacteroidia bacterium]MDW8235635.1 hypothetical protein [Bacteroidia bacterium]
MPTTLNADTLARISFPIEGENLPAPSVSAILHAFPYVWIQFLRHLGCIYCKGLVQDIRAFMESWNQEPRPFLLFVHPNTLEEGRKFFAQFYGGAAHIADPEQKLYRIFGVKRTNLLREMLSQNFFRLYTLLRRGLRNEKPTADPWILHASFLFHHGKLVWHYYAKSLGDVPQWRVA